MFDWNDEELTNILWGEAWEGNGRNVPYLDQIEDNSAVSLEGVNKKGKNEQSSDSVAVERKKFTSKSDHGVALDRISLYDVGERALAFTSDSWPARPSPNAGRTKQDCLGTDAPQNMKEEEVSELDKSSETFEKPEEDAEERDFVFYGWANIGSFDDLDRIFSDNDTIFGDLAVTNADEPWSSSKEITSLPLKFTPSFGDEIKVHNVLYPTESPSSGCTEASKVNCKAPQKVQTYVAEGKNQGLCKLPNDGTAAKPNDTPCKGNKQRRSMRGRESRTLLPSSNNPSQQATSQSIGLVDNPSLALEQQRSSVQSLQAFQLKNSSGVPLAPPLLSAGYQSLPINANSSKTSGEATAKPPPMTPKEKIEKLRRRQQMRAILAIQKQQLHFTNQVSVPENSGLEGDKVAAVQTVGVFPMLDKSSATEQDAQSTISMDLDNCSLEESVLHRLQDSIAKLDMRTRLSIRDSLFRLAQSATQRQYPNDTSSNCTSSRDEACNKDLVRHQRFTRVPDVETETNPIDRTVARLLFHIDLSGKLADTSESPSSKSTANGYFLEISDSSPMISPHGMKSPTVSSNENQSRNTPFFRSSRNPSKDGNSGTMEKSQ